MIAKKEFVTKWISNLGNEPKSLMSGVVERMSARTHAKNVIGCFEARLGTLAIDVQSIWYILRLGNEIIESIHTMN